MSEFFGVQKKHTQPHGNTHAVKEATTLQQASPLSTAATVAPNTSSSPATTTAVNQNPNTKVKSKSNHGPTAATSASITQFFQPMARSTSNPDAASPSAASPTSSQTNRNPHQPIVAAFARQQAKALSLQAAVASVVQTSEVAVEASSTDHTIASSTSMEIVQSTASAELDGDHSISESTPPRTPPRARSSPTTNGGDIVASLQAVADSDEIGVYHTPPRTRGTGNETSTPTANNSSAAASPASPPTIRHSHKRSHTLASSPLTQLTSNWNNNSNNAAGANLPPASPHSAGFKSPVFNFLNRTHRRSENGGSGASPLDPRYLARLATGTSSPRGSGAATALSNTSSPTKSRTSSVTSSPRAAGVPMSPIQQQLFHPSPLRHKRSQSTALPTSPFLLNQPAAANATATAGSPFRSSTSIPQSPVSSVHGVKSSSEHHLRELQLNEQQFEMSDRFIPSRTGSNLEHGYFQQEDQETALMQENVAAAAQNTNGNVANMDGNSGTSNGNAPSTTFTPAYGLLLRSEMLGTKDAFHGDTSLASNLAMLGRESREVNNAALLIHRPGAVGDSTSSSSSSSASGNAATATAPGTTPTSASSAFAAASAPVQQNVVPNSPHALRFKSPRHALLASDPFISPQLVSPDTQKLLSNIKPAQRTIAKMPFKVLDAPNLKDDFYLNLVDWSSQNVVAVALGNAVYLWSGTTTSVAKLFELEEGLDMVTSVSWTTRGKHLAVGTRNGRIQIWDATAQRCVRIMDGHSQRVGSLAWNSHVLASGSRDRNILLHDPRVPINPIAILQSHQQEVCGMKWSHDEHQLASGGNDNKLLIWSTHQHKQPLFRFDDHTAAVKAIAWSPHQHGLMCSGGGTADRCIRFWSTTTGQALSHLDTGSQVCNLLWSKNINEIVSTHGYSLNQICVWKYPSMQQVSTLIGHSLRVLYLAISPDGQTILTGAGDETLRFWNVFPSSTESQ